MEFSKYKVQKVQLQCSDPNERYYWVIFDERDNHTYFSSRSAIYDSFTKDLYFWVLDGYAGSCKPIASYIDNSHDKLLLIKDENALLVKWFYSNKEKAVDTIEKAIIDAII